jgi:hypothetical protein
MSLISTSGKSAFRADMTSATEAAVRTSAPLEETDERITCVGLVIHHEQLLSSEQVDRQL